MKNPEMGAKVVVTKEMRRRFVGTDDGKERRYWESESVEPRVGWVVGFRRLQNGIHHDSSWAPSIHGPDEGYVPAYLEVESTVPVVLVAYWPTLRPVKAPVDGWRDVTGRDDDPYCFRADWLSGDMAANPGWYPRDEKGRFV